MVRPSTIGMLRVKKVESKAKSVGRRACRENSVERKKEKKKKKLFLILPRRLLTFDAQRPTLYALRSSFFVVVW